MTLGERLKTLRKNKHMTLQDLANQFSLGVSTLSQYESNKRTPDYTTLIKFAEFFNVTTDYLLGTDTKPAEIPNELKEIGVEYIALAKNFKDNKIPPEDVEKILKVLKEMKKEDN